MRRSIAVILPLIVPLAGSALEVKPWLGNLYEFVFDADYTYSHYNKVQGAEPGLRNSSNDNVVRFDLGLVPFEKWDTQLELELAFTPRMAGVRSLAAQIRYQLMDDIIGDFVSLTAGVNFRWVTGQGIRDVSTPYHANENGELTVSVGKEWDKGPFWVNRVFALGGLGMANRGSPWNRVLLAYQGNYQDKHRWGIFSEGYYGYGHTDRIKIRHFHGYGKIAHRSVDLGLSYCYMFDYCGSLSFDYAYRIYAHSFPAHVNFFTVHYRLPFSIF